MHSHSFQDTEFKLHRNINDSPGQVVEGLSITPYPQMGQKFRVNHSKNVNSSCIRTVFKIQSSNFTGMSMTPRDRSWRGCRLHRTPRWVRNKGLITEKRKFDEHSHSYQDTKLKLHSYVNDSRRQVVERLTILPYPQRGRE